MSLVLGLGLEHSCPWPRECLSSERLSLASDFFCVLGLEPCVLDSTSADHMEVKMLSKIARNFDSQSKFSLAIDTLKQARGVFHRPPGHLATTLKQERQYNTFRICVLRTSHHEPYRISVPYFSSIFGAYPTRTATKKAYGS